MNSRVAFEKALSDLKRLDEFAKQGDQYAQELKKAYDNANCAVIGMPWPWERKDEN